MPLQIQHDFVAVKKQIYSFIYYHSSNNKLRIFKFYVIVTLIQKKT